MSLTLGANTTDRIEIAAASSINDFSALTMICWIRATTLTTGGRRIFQKGVSGSARKQINWTAAGLVDTAVVRATTSATATTSTVFVVNTWYCIAITYDETNGIKIYWGTLAATMTEASYSPAPTVGTGSTSADNGGVLTWGNNSGATAPHIGQLGAGAYCNRVLTLGEMKQWQSRPQNLSGCADYHQFGFNGTSTQPDWSGNGNAGTVTGATQSDHVPRGPLFGFSPSLPYVVAAASGRVFRPGSLAGLGTGGPFFHSPLT